MDKLIGDIIFNSIRNLFVNQPDVMTYTSETGMTEWNLGHHLANEIKKYLFWLDNDNDVTKPNIDYHRPDAIYHIRGTKKLNFLAVEIKKTNENDYQKDIQKVKEEWVESHHLEYRFGASILIKGIDDWKFTLIQKDSEPIEIFNSTIGINLFKIPNPRKKTIDDFKNLVEEIKESAENQPLVTDLLLENLDKMILKYYNTNKKKNCEYLRFA